MPYSAPVETPEMEVKANSMTYKVPKQKHTEIQQS